jgi:hypothetical protein
MTTIKGLSKNGRAYIMDGLQERIDEIVRKIAEKKELERVKRKNG